MAVNSALSTGVQGIMRGMQGMEASAQRIANAGSSGNFDAVQDLAQPITDLKLYEVNVQASAKVVETADKMLGTLLDTEA